MDGASDTEKGCIMIVTTATSPALCQLVDAIRGAIVNGGDGAAVAARVASALRESLGRPGLLTEVQRLPDPTCYRQHVLHVEPDGSFSIVALVWLPGQATPIHDHVSWCVVGVHEGDEFETRYRLLEEAGRSWLVEDGTDFNPTGSVAALTPPGDIHKVTNQGSGLAISLHVYGADIGRLGSSIRRRYDLEVRTS
jgi:predicted metal-dependent enzyme (double-stranded beta helix superfamily)